MKPGRSLVDSASLVALALAWVGIWGVWIPHRVSALNQHVLYLAEWATFLPAVRYGDMRLTPELLRLALALASVALAASVGHVEMGWLRWAIRAIALIPPLAILPPYPDLTRLWWSESYGWRFTMASVGLIGVVASGGLDYATPKVRRGIVTGLAVGAGVVAILAYAPLKSAFEGYFAERVAPGWGLALFAGGLGLAILLQLARLVLDWRSAAPPAPPETQ